MGQRVFADVLAIAESARKPRYNGSMTPLSLRRIWPVLLIVGLLAIGAVTVYEMQAAGTSPGVADNSTLPPELRRLVPLHTPLAKPMPGEWLAEHHEDGQDYKQYLRSRPIRANPQRRTLYVQPLGEFQLEQRKILDLTAEFLGIYYQLPVKVQADLPLSLVAQSGRRDHPVTGQPQLLSTYILDEVLKPRLPADAVACLALTTADLWPGEGWNFVFGQASLADRVGVWSIHRFGELDGSDEAFRSVLLRTLGTAAHETGHMFSMAHCIYYECAMDGSNSLAEADRHPLWLCPQCLAKLVYATDTDPIKRFRELADFAQRHRLSREHDFWQKSLDALGKP